MQNTLTIAQREFRSYFNGPVAYIVICVVLILLGLFFWQPFFVMQRATVRDMFRLLSIFLVFAVPALTMGLLAEEKRTGTIELLITMPVRDSEVILGKFLGVLGLFAVMLLLTLPYPLTVSTLGDLDWGQVVTGYLGLLLQGGAMLAVGLLASSWTKSQIVAFFIALGLCGLLWLIDWFLPFMPAGLASIAEYVSLEYHRQSMSRGVIDTRNLFYFVGLAGIALVLAFRSLESRRWK
jgi:ABC-2 type transport system permease protein